MAQPAEVFGELLSEITKISAHTINMGFFMAAAIAWNEVVKSVIKNLPQSRSQATFYFALYALLLTVVSAIVFMLTKKFVDENAQRAQLAYVVQ